MIFMRLGTWNMRKLYISGSLKTVAGELAMGLKMIL